MLPGSKFYNQSLLMQPNMSDCSSDSLLSQNHMGYLDTGDDLLLADAGYNVKAADLALVAQRLEQLESLCASQDPEVLSDAVHYNPSDLAGWIECMIGELAPSLLAVGDICSTDGAVSHDVFPQKTPLHFAVEDEYGDFNMGSCTSIEEPMDQHSSSQQLDTQSSHANSMPKQSSVTHPSAQSTSSISQLIKNAIGHSSSSANGPRYDSKEYSGMVLLNDETGEFQPYKVKIQDQASSNQPGGFYQGGVRDRSPEGPLSNGFPDRFNGQQAALPKSSSMPCLQPQQHATSMQQRQQLHQPHRKQPHNMQHEIKPTAALAPSHSSNGRAPYQGTPHTPHHHQQQRQLRQQPAEVRPQELMIRATSPPSNSSPMTPYQQHSGCNDKDSYLHMQHMTEKLPHSQPHTLQGGTCVDDDDEGAQESGIRLVQLLMACAEAIQKNELTAALDMVTEIRRLASSNNGAMAKVANYFVEALAQRLYGASIQDWASLSQANALSDVLYSNFYETCPYLKFAHFTANQAILEAFEGHKFVHVIDFNLMHGLQWQTLIQALAVRPGGPPHLRMTGIGPPQPDNKDVLQEIGTKLGQIATSVNVDFSFRGVVATKLDDVHPRLFEVKQGEAVAVNSILQLHQLLYGKANSQNSMAPIDEVLMSVKSLSPKVVTLVEQEANHNSPMFLERFVEALHYYCTMFDSLEACSLPPQCMEMTCTEIYLAREIVNIVACEGLARVERHESLSQWRERMSNAGFQPVHLGSDTFKKASMLVKLFSGEGYTVEENRGCLTLGWHSRPLIAASAWRCG